jgi:hypothetical protein
MGTGTTGVVCSEFGVRFIGSENDQECFEKAWSRITTAYYVKYPDMGKYKTKLKYLDN